MRLSALSSSAAGRANDRLPVEIKCAAAHRIADLFHDRNRFASQRRFIGRRRAFNDQAIDWKKFAGFDEQLVCRSALPQSETSTQRPFSRRNACFGATLSNDSIDFRVR